MSSKDTSSADWSLESVMETLRKQVKNGTAVVQVFLDAPQTKQDLKLEAERHVEEATRRTNQPSASASIGNVHQLARSFSVTASPDVIEQIARAPGVRAILPSEVSDILIRPVRKAED